MKTFSIELIGTLPEYDYANLNEKSYVEFTIPAKISVSGIPIIQDNGEPIIDLFLPIDFNWLLDVIEGKKGGLCLTDFGSVMYFRKKGESYLITLGDGSALRNGQSPIKDISIACRDVEKETLDALNKFIKMVGEKNPKLLKAKYMKGLVAGANRLDKKLKRKIVGG